MLIAAGLTPLNAAQLFKPFVATIKSKIPKYAMAMPSMNLDALTLDSLPVSSSAMQPVPDSTQVTVIWKTPNVIQTAQTRGLVTILVTLPVIQLNVITITEIAAILIGLAIYYTTDPMTDVIVDVES